MLLALVYFARMHIPMRSLHNMLYSRMCRLTALPRCPYTYLSTLTAPIANANSLINYNMHASFSHASWRALAGLLSKHAVCLLCAGAAAEMLRIMLESWQLAVAPLACGRLPAVHL